MTFLNAAPPADELARVRYLFTDIDDTLTTGGRLLPETYQALWDLSAAGISIVPVTGGSAGWAEHIVRTWPVAAVVGESGAFALGLEGRKVAFEFWGDEQDQRERQRRHLAELAPLLDEEGFRLAHDQEFRLADVAIDIDGHQPAAINRLLSRIRDTGARAVASSIHVNTWIGDYDKRAMSERLLATRFHVPAPDVGAVTAFVGDSRNDAPMFSFIRNSFGVGNLTPYLDELPRPPRWIASRPAGHGFADIARAILAARRPS
jgi:HAD superfamily hydrolase (TIGR01484 family)